MDARRGWGILWTVLGVLTGALAVQAFGAESLDAFLLQAIRWTARLSFPCFLLAWSASSLHTVFDAPFTRWQMANRRYLGVTFAIVHLVHLVFLISRAIVTSGASLEGRGWIDFGGGGLAYLFVVAMLLTSFEPVGKLLSPGAWKAVHALGGWWIAIVFLNSYGYRALENPAFLPQAVALSAVILLRIYLAVIERRDRGRPA